MRGIRQPGYGRKEGDEVSAKFKTYCCRYYHDGTWWALDIKAADWADAEARVNKLGNLQLQGELVMTIPGWMPCWMIRFTCWVRNLFSTP